MAISFNFVMQVCISLVATLLVFADMQPCEAAHVFQAFKMVQWNRGGTNFGSRRAAVNLFASSFEHLSDMGRRILVSPIEDLTVEIVDNIRNGTTAAGLLILLPEDMDKATPSASLLEKWLPVEQKLMESEVLIPVYFSYTDPQLLSMHEQILSSSPSADGFQLVANVNEQTEVKTPSARVYQGSLSSTAQDGESARTIAVIANYDTWGIAPELAVGTDSNGSGTIAVLEIARLFARLYSGLKTQGKYNLLFVLAGGDDLNFQGTKGWLDSADSRLLDQIEFALCLDSLGSGGDLYLHVSRPPKDPLIASLSEELSRRAAAEGKKLHLVHKKINVNNPTVGFAHEQFSRKQIVAATLSGSPSPHPFHHRSALFDRRPAVSTENLLASIHLAAEALAAHIYGLNGKDVDVFASNDINVHSISAWLDTLSSTSRVTPFLSSTDPLFESLSRAFTNVTSEVTETVVPLDKAWAFYSGPAVQMSMFNIKPFTFDLIFFALECAYFFLLFVLLRGWKAFEAVREFFSGGEELKAGGSKRRRD